MSNGLRELLGGTRKAIENFTQSSAAMYNLNKQKEQYEIDKKIKDAQLKKLQYETSPEVFERMKRSEKIKDDTLKLQYDTAKAKLDAANKSSSDYLKEVIPFFQEAKQAGIGAKIKPDEYGNLQPTEFYTEDKDYKFDKNAQKLNYYIKKDSIPIEDEEGEIEDKPATRENIEKYAVQQGINMRSPMYKKLTQPRASEFENAEDYLKAVRSSGGELGERAERRLKERGSVEVSKESTSQDYDIKELIKKAKEGNREAYDKIKQLQSEGKV